MKEKKNNKNILIISSVGVILLLAIAVIINLNDKSRIFKGVINNVYDIAKDNLKKYKKIPDTLTKSTKINASIDTSFNETISLTGSLNPKDKIAILGAKLGNNQKDILDGSFIYQDNKAYIKSNTLLTNIYEISNILSKCSEEECSNSKGDFNTLLDNLFITNTYDYETLNRLVKNLHKVLIDSIDKKYITKKNITTLINNKDKKVTKYTYTLNKASLTILINNIDKNKTLKDDLFTMYGKYLNSFGITKENFKKEIINKATLLGTLNIYTTGYNKIEKVNITLPDNLEVNIELVDNHINIELEENKRETSIIIDYNKDTKTANLTYYNPQGKVIELEIKLEDKKIDIAYTFYAEDTKYIGNIINETKTSDEEKLSGELTLKLMGMSLQINYDIDYNAIVEKENTTNATPFKELSAEEIQKIEQVLKDLLNTDLGKTILEGLDSITGSEDESLE